MSVAEQRRFAAIGVAVGLAMVAYGIRALADGKASDLLPASDEPFTCGFEAKLIDFGSIALMLGGLTLAFFGVPAIGASFLLLLSTYLRRNHNDLSQSPGQSVPKPTLDCN
jgi:hypothetical protein